MSEDDPARELLMRAVDAGLMTPQLAAELDAWAGELATEVTEGRMTKADADRAIQERLAADLRRRGSA